MAKQKKITKQKKNIVRQGKKGGGKKTFKKVMVDKGPKIKGKNSPLFGSNSPHPLKVTEPKEESWRTHYYWFVFKKRGTYNSPTFFIFKYLLMV